MVFSLKIECGNDDFSCDHGAAKAAAISRCLNEVSRHLKGRVYDKLLPGEEGRIHDVNGNTVGNWIYQ